MTWRTVILAVLATVFTAEIVVASAPSRSLRPLPRTFAPETVKPDRVIFDRVAPGLKSVIRPRPRPGRSTEAVAVPESVVRVSAAAVLAESVRPAPRPQSVRGRKARRAVAVRTKPTPLIPRGRKGSICGIKAIKGEKLSPIAGRLKGCGLSEPVRVTSVDGVVLTQAAIMDCGTAKALNKWVQKGVKPTVGRLGGGVSSLKVVAHYACRTRNNQPGAKISEHGKGRAIDIAAINLKNGVSLAVLNGWRDRTQGKLLKTMHRSACGPFGTVLGPNADKFHQDHFHLDTARYRSGSYCR